MMPVMLRTASVDFDLIEPPARGRRRRGGPLVLERSASSPGYVVVDGHERYEAHDRAGARRVCCLIREADADDPLELLAELSSLGGHDAIDEARAIDEAMRRLGSTQRGFAALTGLNQPHISKRLKLLRLSPRDQRRLRDGVITVDEALRLAPPAPR
jgi:ParB-like chromosome segregation protein Spo0J